jgi:hypothetical protein
LITAPRRVDPSLPKLVRWTLFGAFLIAPCLASCTGDLDPAVRAMDLKGGSGGDSSGSGSGGSTSSGGTTGTGGMVSSGGQTGSASGGSSGTLANCDAPGMVFKDSTVGCQGAGCHSAQMQTPDLSGSDGSVLKGMKALSLCTGDLIVNPADPTSSVLYKVVAGTSCNQTRMPLLGPPFLSQTQIDCVAGWIANIQ